MSPTRKNAIRQMSEEQLATRKKDLMEELDRVQSEVRRKTAGVRFRLGEQDMIFIPGAWRDVAATNVQLRLCSLNAFTENKTVANVRFLKGGKIEPHTHEEYETIHVLEGTYHDPVNGVTLEEDDVQRIPPGQLHAGESDHCLLYVTWRPALPEAYEDDDPTPIC